MSSTLVVGWRRGTECRRESGARCVKPLRFNRANPRIFSCANRSYEYFDVDGDSRFRDSSARRSLAYDAVEVVARTCTLLWAVSLFSNSRPMLLCFLFAVGWVQGCDPAGAASVAAGGGRGSLVSGGFEVAKRSSGEALGCGARRPRRASRSRKSPRGPASGAVNSFNATGFRSLRGLSPRTHRGQGR